jgi:hypothetical protein
VDMHNLKDPSPVAIIECNDSRPHEYMYTCTQDRKLPNVRADLIPFDCVPLLVRLWRN